MRIAICDDEKAVRNQLQQTINLCDYIKNDTVITEFSSGEELVDAFAKKAFDIVFLDMHMYGMSGLEAAQTLRNADRNVITIFLTSHQQYVFESFKIEVFDYIMKPVNVEVINDVLSRAVKKYRVQHHIIECKTRDETHALTVNEIIYIEGYRRHVVFFTKDVEYECIGKLNEYEEQLVPYGFLRCHQGFLINMNYIKSIEINCIITVNNQRIDMSARKRQECLEAFNTFLTKYRV